MFKQHLLCILLVAICLFVVTSPAFADAIRVTGAFTSFSGVVFGDLGPTMFSFCPADTCAGPVGTGQFQVCPDSGCSTDVGMATNVPIGGNPTFDIASRLFFTAAGGTENALLFRAASFPDPNDPGPNNFKIGTLTFINGLWTGNAKFGFSIVATDSTISRTERFDGFINLQLTSPNTGTPQQNADYIYITNSAGVPVANPLTLKPLPSIRAYELADSPTGSNSVTVDIRGAFGSLDFLSFENPTEGGFLDVSLTDELAGPPASQVPEPATFVLIGSVLGIATLKRKFLR
jgi:hypothetical protein